MNKIKLLTDSGCDLPKEILEKYNVGIIGLNVSFDGEHFISGEEIDNETFYNKMKGVKNLPKTSCPSPERFIDAYKGDEDVLLLTVTSALSGTYSSAKLGKDMYDTEYGNKKVEVVDSKSGSIGQGLLVIKAGELIAEGKSLEEVVKEIEALREEMVFYGTLETLENAIKGGRINPIAGKLINALNFKAIIHITEGVVKPIDKARGVNNSLKKVLEYIDNNLNEPEVRTLVIGHAHCKEKAMKVKETLESKYTFKETIVAEVGPVMGTYTSEGAILVSVL